jgi:MFS family permease
LSVAFIVGRAAFGHLPDRIGGAKVALVCILIEAAGQALIWLAPWSAVALIGVALSGLGYSLVYPGLGVEAIRRAPPQSRGLAMGAYTACLDLTLGLASPALGLIAGGAGLEAVYLVSTLVVLSSAVIAMRLMSVPPHPPPVDVPADAEQGAPKFSLQREVRREMFGCDDHTDPADRCAVDACRGGERHDRIEALVDA